MSRSCEDLPQTFRTLPEALRFRAEERPHEIGFSFLLDGEEEAGGHLTYGHLDRLARAIGALLQQHGAQGERVLLLYPPGLGYVAAFFGCLYAGAVAVPAYPPRQNRSLPRLQAIIADARPQVALTTAAILSRVEGWLADSPELRSLAWETTDAVALDLAERWEEPAAGAESLAFLQYTSGSTGIPKGVVLSHGNLLHNLELMRLGFDLSPDSRGVIWLPPYHDMGLIGGILQPLYAGFPVTLMSPASFLQRPLRWLQAISRLRATSTAGPNFAYDLCARRISPEEREGLDLSCWTVAINGAEPIRAEALERFVAAFGPCGFRPEAFCPSYGLAEATLIVSGGRRRRPPREVGLDAAALERNRMELPTPGGPVRRLVGCGEVLGGQTVRIVDPESLAPCPPGVVGEIWVAGQSVAQGYWQRIEETQAVFRAITSSGESGYLRTGDLGFFTDGELFVTGRIKDLIILRGRNLYPQDIELTMERAHPALAASSGAAFSVEMEGEERLVVVSEVARGSGLDVEQVAAAIRQAVVEEFEVQVRDVVLVRTATIPRTTSGKIQRRACREAYLAGSLTVVGRSAIEPGELFEDGKNIADLSRDELLLRSAEERSALLLTFLRQQAAHSLQVPLSSVSPDLALGALGLDSLGALELRSRVEAGLGVELPLSALLAGASAADLTAKVLASLEVASERGQEPPATAAPKREHPLSHGQQALWFLERLAPGSAVHNLAAAVRVREGFRKEALYSALRRLMDRHPALRTTVMERQGSPWQRIHERLAPTFAEVEATAWGNGQVEARLAAEAGRPFDLEVEPPFRCLALYRGSGEVILLWVVHHLAADFGSVAVLLRDLGVLYAAALAGSEAALEPLPCRFVDLVLQERRLLEGERGERLWDFWRHELAEGVADLDLPGDRPRPAFPSYAGGSRMFLLDRDLTDRLRALARSRSVTLYACLLATFQALLARISGQEQLAVGCPATGRRSARTARLVGYLVNPVPVRADLRGAPTFEELLVRVRQRLLATLEHAELPFPLLADRLAPARDPSRSPIFQVMCLLHGADPRGEEGPAALALGRPGVRLDLGPLRAETTGFLRRSTDLDLTLAAAELGGLLAGTLTYAADLFDAVTAERLLERFQSLLAGAVEGPDRPMVDLPLLRPAERHALLLEWNDTARALPAQRTLHGLVEAQAARTPEAVAVELEGRQLSYAELDRRAGRLAHHLATLGVGPDTSVGICAERSLEMVLALLATLKAGGAYLPLDPESPRERLATMLDDARVPVVLAQRALRERVESALPAPRPPVISLDDLDDLPGIPGERKRALPRVGEDHLAYVIYTSGSSGRPKGVMVSHGGICNRLLWGQETYRLTASDRVLQKTPYTFDVSVWEIFWPLLTGGRLCMAVPGGHRDPAWLSRTIAERGVTTLHFVPSMLRAFLQEPPAAGGYPSLRRVFCSGEALTVEVRDQLFAALPGVELYNLYGPTEASVEVTFWECRPGDDRGNVPIGRPIGNTTIQILNRRGEPAPIGVPGELHIGGVGLARGYLARPDLTAERFVPAPFGPAGARLYATGDLARTAADGTIEFLGRLDHQVKVRGFRIEPGEIEAALLRYPGIEAAVAVARPDGSGSIRLVAYLVAGGEAPAAGELRRFLDERLPSYMVPAAFVILDRLPMTASGKIDRRALPEPGRERPCGGEAYEPPRTSKERLLARIWAEVLGLERVGARDNFFELGGDSILSLQVISRAAAAGLRLQPRQLFQHQTVESLAAAGTLELSTAEEEPARGPAPLTPIQRWFLEQERPDLHHFNQAVLLRTREGMRPELLAAAAGALVDHHDALRLRFYRRSEGWSQVHDTPGPPPFTQLDLAALPETRRPEAVATAAAALQEGFELARGPLFRAALFALGARRPGRLLLVAHHLVVDGVSWRILLEDLERAYLRLERGMPAELPPRTTSFQSWAGHLVENARAGAAPADLAAWERLRLPVRDLTPDEPEGADTEAAAHEVSIVLSREETRTLLLEVPRAYGARPDHVLLAALAEAWGRRTGSTTLRLDVEGHGRKADSDRFDLSRTVGWLTVLFPAMLEIPAGSDPGETLRTVCEQLAAAEERSGRFARLRHLSPDPALRERLCSLPRAPVLFNYLGQLDRALAGSRLFTPAAEPAGPFRGGRGARSHALEVEARIEGGVLRATLRHGGRHRRSTVEALAGDFAQAVRALLASCPETTRGIEDTYPLSPTQEGLLFHTLHAAEPGLYISQLSCAFEGDLDEAAFVRTWGEMLDRHPVLRTAIAWRHEEAPLQVVQSYVEPPLLRLDALALQSCRQQELLDEILREDRRRGFSLDSAPLLRLVLIRCGARQHRLVWSHHHVLLDGWSLSLLTRELFLLYGAFRRNREPGLERPRPFRDYIDWLCTQDLREAEDFWREALAGFRAPTPIGVDYDPWRRPGEAGERSLGLTANQTEELRSLARRRRLTLSVLLQGAWALLLGRISGELDVVYGVTFSGRPPGLAGIESMVGLFINTLPLRTAVAPGERLLPWLAALQERNVAVRQHEHSPLVRVHGWAGVPRGGQLFDSLVIFENYPVDEALREAAEQAAGLTLREVRNLERTNYPLTLVGMPGHALALRLGFDGRRIDAVTAERMLRQVGALLAGIVEKPESCVDEVPLLGAAERHQVLVEWSAVPSGSAAEPGPHRLLEQAAAAEPDAVALSWTGGIGSGGSLTWRELNRRSNALARFLRAQGAGPERLVGLFLERSPELVTAILAVWKAGAAYVPLDPSYPPERLAWMLADSGCRWMLAAGPLPASMVLPDGAALLRLDDLTEAVAEASAKSAEDLGLEIAPESLAYVIYTSGSTGRPKGVLVTHHGLGNLAAEQARDFAVPAGGRVLQLASPSFDASVSEIAMALRARAELVLGSREELLPGPDLARLLRERAITTVTLPPSALAALPDRDVPALRTLVVAGEACPPGLADVWAEGRFFFNAYGPTEATVCATLGRHSAGERFTLGRPLGGARVHVLDVWGDPAPPGVPGEICLGGAGLARGYLGRPDLTAERFVPDPFAPEVGERLYRTGDLARYAPDGRIELLGRIDHQVKIRGVRVELGEVEAALRRQPGVRQAVAAARRGPDGVAALVAWVVPEEGEQPVETALRRALAEALPQPLVPSAIMLLPELPLSPNGKVDRQALPGPGSVRDSRPRTAPRTPAEELVAAIWADVLGLTEVAADDDFFELGGHSLLAGRMTARLRAAFGVGLPLRTVLEARTVAAVAAAAEAARRSGVMPPAPPIARVARGGPLPLSFGQERLWILEQLDPGTAAYNVPSALHIEGPLSVAVLERAFGEVVRRHEALRTVLPAGADGRPVQVVLPPSPFVLPLVDLQEVSGAEDETLRLAVAEARRSFDLGRGPLLRVAVLRRGPADHLLLYAVHHAISDEWSTRILVREVAACYGAFAEESAPDLPEPPVQYVDWAVWQRSWLQGEVLTAELAWWRERLRGAPTVLSLPTDRPRPPVWRSRGATRRVALSGRAGDVDQFGRQAGATSFMVLLAAFQALLLRWTGQEDLVVGTPVAGRGHLETEGMVGFLVNTLVIRAGVTEETTAADLLARTREAVLEAHAHQDAPFEKLVEELHARRDLSHQALFQVLFVFHEASDELPSLGPASLRRVEIDTGTARLDWTLTLERQGGGLTAALEFATDLFDGTTAERALQHYARLLTGIARDPAARISDLPLLGTAERHQIVAEWNDTQVAIGGGRVHERIAARAAASPEVVAVSCDGASLAYGELEARSNRLARYLVRLGVGPEALVAVCLECSPDLLVALLAVWKAGGAYMPLDPCYPRERLDYMLGDAGAPVLLTQQSLSSLGSGGAARMVCLDTDAPRIALEEAVDPGIVVDAGQTAYVIYTSGSTGRPKGVQVLHGALTNFLDALQAELALGPGDRLLAVTSLSFDIAGLELFLPAMAGAEVVLCSRDLAADGTRLRERLESGGVTVMQATPSTWRLLWDAGWRGDGRLAVLCGGEALDPVLAARLAKAGGGLWNLYGPTETTIWSAFSRPEGGAVTLGRPLANTAIHLLDRSLRPVPAGIPGGLYIGGEGLARGYLRRPDLTAEKFLPDPFADRTGARLYATGDLARRLPDGRLEFLGRLDHQVKIRGYRIELGEVEAALVSHPGVKQAVVAPHLGGGSLVAYWVSGRAPALSGAELREHLKQSLPEHALPSFFVEMAELPLTPNGKVDRRALPAPDGIGPDLGGEGAPRTPAEEVLTGLFASLLGRERVGVHEDFFLLGGQSLLAAQVVARVREIFGVSLPLRRLFETPTAAGVAALLEQERAPRTEPPHPVSREGDLPLSSNQERLWFLDQLDPGAPAYHLALTLRIEGELDRSALERALATLMVRHESLRTTFPDSGGQAAQVIVAQPDLALPLADLGALAGSAARTEALRLVAAEAQHPFDLARGPLLRGLLVRLAAAEHLLALTIHHIVSDGWSNQILIREAAALYDAFRRGRPSPFSPLPLQYADFAVWQRRWLAEEEAAAQLAWWRDRLGGAPPALELPTDRLRPAVQTSRGGAVPLVLPEEVTGLLRTAARAEGCTLFMALLAVFQVLLARITGQTDIAVGSPVANRRWPSTEAVIGFFANTLVLRSDLDGDPSFRELLLQVREAALGAYDHADLPFEKLVEELAPVRDLSRPPLFQVLFALQNAPLAVLELPGLALRPLALDPGVARFDLELSLEERAGTLAGALIFNRNLFDAATALRLAGHLQNLFAAAATEPFLRLSALPLLGEPECHALLCEWGAAREWEAAELPVHRQLELCAAAHPGAPAVICDGEVVSYGALNRWANRLAHRLRRLGVGPEVRVALHAGRSAGLAAGLLGILKAGGAYVPLDPTLPRERQAFVLADCGAPVVVGETRWCDRLPANAPRVVLLDADDLAEESGDDPAVAVGPGDLAYVIYTSGSTGRPKGVLVEHGSLAQVLAAGRREFGWDAADRMPVLAPFSFDIFLFELFHPLLAGGCCVLVELHPVLDLSRLVALLGEVTRLHAVPALMRQIVEAVRARGAVPRLRTLFVGGDTVPADLLAALRETFPEAEIRILYGPTEGTIICTSHRVPPGEPVGRPLLGRPLEGVVLQTRDAGGAPAPIGVAGEIFLAGPGIARGYLGREELTAERFPHLDGRRWYRTGDLARWLPDGTLEFLGRVDQQVKIRGFRIELGEIEAVLREQPEVREAVVVVRDSAGGDRRLVAYVVGDGPAMPPAAELRARLAERLPTYMVPAVFVPLEALPLTRHGKVDRRALPAPPSVERGDLGTFVAPRTPMEESLAVLWEQVLETGPVGRADDFFALGGHSLLATRLMSRVRETFRTDLPLRSLFEEPTVAGLVARIEAAWAAGITAAVPPLTPVPRDGELPLSFAQQRLWFLDQVEPGTSLYNVPLAVRLRGPLAMSALERSFQEIVRRHEVLRTAFIAERGRARQVVMPPEPVPLHRIDLSALPRDEREAEIGRALAQKAGLPFDLGRPPLVRVALLRLGADEHVLLAVLHHIVGDDWSSGVLLRELASLYDAFVSGRPSPLPELGLQYADFAAWQRRLLQREALEAHLSFWTRRLAGIPELRLPTDRPRPEAPAFRGADEALTVPLEVSSAIRALSRSLGVPHVHTLLAAFQALLFRVTGQEDLAVGIDITGRDRVETEPLIGFFVNLLVLRADLEGDPTFLELVQRTHRATLEAYEHQALPFERLVEALRLERSLEHTPLIRALFSFQAAFTLPPRLRDLELERVEVASGRAKRDLTLFLRETPTGFAGAFNYNRDLFEAATIARLARDYNALLARAVHQPETRLLALELSSDAERRGLAAQRRRRSAAALASLLQETALNTGPGGPEEPATP